MTKKGKISKIQKTSSLCIPKSQFVAENEVNKQRLMWTFAKFKQRNKETRKQRNKEAKRQRNKEAHKQRNIETMESRYKETQEQKHRNKETSKQRDPGTKKHRNIETKKKRDHTDASTSRDLLKNQFLHVLTPSIREIRQKENFFGPAVFCIAQNT